MTYEEQELQNNADDDCYRVIRARDEEIEFDWRPGYDQRKEAQ